MHYCFCWLGALGCHKYILLEYSSLVITYCKIAYFYVMINKGLFDCVFTEATASPGKQQNLNSPQKAGNNFLLKAKISTSNFGVILSKGHEGFQ